MQKNKKLGSKGFTLIELLIVIIIIGILAAIAFVAYSGSQTKAHQADAESTVAQAKNKLQEYDASNGNYPTDQASFNTWLGSADGGNNTTFAGNFTTAKGYTYTASPTGCDNSTTACSGYTVVAAKANTQGSADITETN